MLRPVDSPTSEARVPIVTRLSNRAAKDLQSLPGPMQERARELCARLDQKPASGKKLLGKLQGIGSARLGRTHRILYRDEEQGVLVLTIAPRRDAYR